MTAVADAPARRQARPPAAPPAAEADVTAALIRVVQVVSYSIAGMIGRGDMSPNATLVRLGAAREDVETLRAFLAGQPRPAHIPDPEEI